MHSRMILLKFLQNLITHLPSFTALNPDKSNLHSDRISHYIVSFFFAALRRSSEDVAKSGAKVSIDKKNDESQEDST
jgi:hypothetical protein